MKTFGRNPEDQKFVEVQSKTDYLAIEKIMFSGLNGKNQTPKLVKNFILNFLQIEYIAMNTI